jgi:hypothetical protein
MFQSLRKDGLWPGLGIVPALLREVSAAVCNVGPYLLRALLPGYNPRQDADLRWQQDWIAGHRTLPAGAPLPLLDTNDPDIPVPFGRALSA